MYDDKGPNSLYAQIETQKAQARQDFEASKSQAWNDYFQQLDNQPTFIGTYNGSTSKKSSSF